MTKCHVVSQIMSSGKSCAMANLLNYDSYYRDKKIIYVAPFLSECERFKNACNRTFIEPRAWDQYGGSKLKHIALLLSEQKSVSTTHAALSLYDENIISLIKSGEYILIMDETCNVVEELSFNAEDVWLLEQAGVIRKDGTAYRFNDHAHYVENKGTLSGIVDKMRYMDLHGYSGERGEKFYYYTMPPAVLQAFSEIFVLTYMWECSDLRLVMDSIGMEWEYLYVDKVDFGNGYMITEKKPEVPDYVIKIPDLIDVYEYSEPAKKLGRPPKDLNKWRPKHKGREGRDEPVYFDRLSVSFFENEKKNAAIITELRNNIRTYFDSMMSKYDGTTMECMWSTYKDHMGKLYSSKNAWMEDQFVSFNERAKNDYAHCKFMAYAVDIFPRPTKKGWYESFGGKYPERDVALSTMVQWIYRGQIRRGKKIHVFVPSERMRGYLEDWIAEISQGEKWIEI